MSTLKDDEEEEEEEEEVKEEDCGRKLTEGSCGGRDWFNFDCSKVATVVRVKPTRSHPLSPRGWDAHLENEIAQPPEGVYPFAREHAQPRREKGRKVLWIYKLRYEGGEEVTEKLFMEGVGPPPVRGARTPGGLPDMRILLATSSPLQHFPHPFSTLSISFIPDGPVR
ncbi:hypothetical protein V1478_000533 [Vespula squamosa]|uniref:Uncharacterized protein n=1 Tax=Vespula squamosa TaxID=30214 RepID=A0ABD2C5S7_VESSQ